LYCVAWVLSSFPPRRSSDLLAGSGAYPRLPALPDGVGQALGEVRAGLADLVFDVPLDRALRDTELLGHGAGALELLDQVTHLRPGALGDGAGEGPLHGPVQAVVHDAHGGHLRS